MVVSAEGPFLNESDREDELERRKKQCEALFDGEHNTVLVDAVLGSYNSDFVNDQVLRDFVENWLIGPMMELAPTLMNKVAFSNVMGSQYDSTYGMSNDEEGLTNESIVSRFMHANTTILGYFSIPPLAAQYFDLLNGEAFDAMVLINQGTILLNEIQNFYTDSEYEQDMSKIVAEISAFNGLDNDTDLGEVLSKRADDAKVLYKQQKRAMEE